MAGDSIFVTGASGFIGGAPTRALVADGKRVRALARSAAAAEAVEALGKARPEIGYEPVITVEHGLEELAAA